MPLQTGYYKVSNANLCVALDTDVVGTPLNLRTDDNSTQLKWHFDSQQSGAFYLVYSEYAGTVPKPGAAPNALPITPDMDIVGDADSGSDEWVLSSVPGLENTYTVSLNDYAWTNTGTELKLRPLDHDFQADGQKWVFTRWRPTT